MPELEEWLPPREIVMREMNGLRGRLCSVIESLGLPTKQEKAIVTMIKQSSYQQQYTLAELIDNLDNEQTLFKYTGNKLEKKIC